jgi:hypothetical protein
MKRESVASERILLCYILQIKITVTPAQAGVQEIDSWTPPAQNLPLQKQGNDG